jgi:hypothetical protein
MQKYDYFYNIARLFQANDHTARNNEFDSAVRSDRHEDFRKAYSARLLAFYR